jgi:hypothetical protein
MKKLLILVTVLLFSATGYCQITAQEKAKAADLLKLGFDGLINSVNGLSEQQLNYKPDSTRWSIKECVYHLALSETNIWGWMQGVMAAPANPDKRVMIKATDEQIIAGVEDRSHKVKTSEPFEPKNAKWAGKDEALAFLKDERFKHINYIKESADDYRNHISEQGPMGAMDAYQIVLLMAQHTVRHTKQVEEIKASTGFPAK